MAAFDLDVSVCGKRCTVAASGDLDLMTTPFLTAVSEAKLGDTAVTMLILDLARVSRLDRTGIAAILDLCAVAHEFAKDLYVTNAAFDIQQMLSLARLDDLLGEPPTDP